MKGLRRLALAFVALLVLVGSAVGIDEVLWRGAHAAAVASAVSSAILDPGAIFAARSPGDRGSGPLQQTKPGRITPATYTPQHGPEERVLPGIRERIGEPDFAPPAPPPPLNQTLPGMSGPTTPGGGGSPPVPPPSPPITFTSLPPPMDGPPGQQSPPGGGPPFSPPTSPVPEPSAWLLMNLALFSIGAALRRARSRDRAAHRAAAGSHA
jgi:hypothetical protein